LVHLSEKTKVARWVTFYFKVNLVEG